MHCTSSHISSEWATASTLYWDYWVTLEIALEQIVNISCVKVRISAMSLNLVECDCNILNFFIR